MIIRRRWVDEEGKPHAELATWLPASAADERGRVLEIPEGAELIEGPPEELTGALLLAALADPAAEPGADLGALYELPLREGAQLATPEQFASAEEAALEADQEARAAVADDLAAQAAEREAPRRAALTKLAESAGLDPAELAALLGEAG